MWILLIPLALLAVVRVLQFILFLRARRAAFSIATDWKYRAIPTLNAAAAYGERDNGNVIRRMLENWTSENLWEMFRFLNNDPTIPQQALPYIMLELQRRGIRLVGSAAGISWSRRPEIIYEGTSPNPRGLTPYFKQLKLNTEVPKLEPVDLDKRKCPICQMSEGEEWVACSVCGLVHHKDCWEYTGKCAAYGCKCTSTVLPPPAEQVYEQIELPARPIPDTTPIVWLSGRH
jgi:hypothetical protein